MDCSVVTGTPHVPKSITADHVAETLKRADHGAEAAAKSPDLYVS